MSSETQSSTTPVTEGSHKKSRTGVDSCWHVAMLAGLVASVTSVAMANSGFFFVGFMEEFGVNRQSASWPNNAITALGHLSGILLAVLQRRITLFHTLFFGGLLAWAGIVASAFVPNMACMTVTFGVLHGLGFGLTLMTLSVILAMYFDRYRGFASGIKYVGMSCSGLVFPKLLDYLQREYGFRGMLLICGGITTHVTAFGLFLKEPPWVCIKPHDKTEGTIKATTGIECQLPTMDQHTDHATTSTTECCKTFSSLLVLLRQPIFHWILWCAVIADLTGSVFRSTIVDYAVDKGLSLSEADSLIVYGSCAEIAGRLFVPLIGDARWIQRSTLVMINFLIAGGSMIFMPHAIPRTQVVFVCLCVYISLGCVSTLKTVLMADYLGIQWISTCFGVSGLLVLPLTFSTPAIIGERSYPRSPTNLSFSLGPSAAEGSGPVHNFENSAPAHDNVVGKTKDGSICLRKPRVTFTCCQNCCFCPNH